VPPTPTRFAPSPVWRTATAARSPVRAARRPRTGATARRRSAQPRLCARRPASSPATPVTATADSWLTRRPACRNHNLAEEHERLDCCAAGPLSFDSLTAGGRFTPRRVVAGGSQHQYARAWDARAHLSPVPSAGSLERIGNPERWADSLGPVGFRNGGERLHVQSVRQQLGALLEEPLHPRGRGDD